MGLFSDTGSVHEVAAEAVALILRLRAPFTVAVHPSPGAAATIEVCATPSALLRADPAAGRWVVLEGGITTPMLVTFPGPVAALRLSSSGAETVFEVVQ
jgi:hypothetical protein